MKYLLCICLCGFYSSIRAGDLKYPVSEIPADMIEGMYAVIREQRHEFEIISKSKSRLRFKRVVTILNAKAKNYAVTVVGYDKDTQVDFLEGAVYDATGKQVKKLKNSDIIDRSAVSGYSLYEDNRVKIADLSNDIYPYTIEVEYQVSDALYSIPGIILYTDDEISTQHMEYTITFPKVLKPRYRVFNMPEPAKAMLDKDKEKWTWVFSNIKPEKFERMAPSSDRHVPNVMLAPSEFEYGGYAGNMSSWKSLGEWQTMLNKGRDVLPDETKAKIRELTAPAKTDQEKIKIVYQYMQSKTRYVSIQLGIGGFQPFDTKTVDQTGYGDCKALSNYMVAMLKEIGVKAYYSWVFAGSGGGPHITKEFPVDRFNHIIVAVPLKQDTVWLECTNQSAPFGYLGDFTDNRYALLITEEGGKLVKTPRYTADQNRQNTRAEIEIQPTGEAVTKMQMTLFGLQSENQGLSAVIASAQPDEQRKWLERAIDLPSFNIRSFQMKQAGDFIPQAQVWAEVEVRKYATVSGKRLFIAPNMLNRYSFVPEKTEARRTPIVRRMAFEDTDTLVYSIPEQFYPEYLPPSVKLASDFGEYEATFTVDQHKLIYTRRLRMNDGEYEPVKYAEMTEFFRNITKADNIKIVFVNKT